MIYRNIKRWRPGIGLIIFSQKAHPLRETSSDWLSRFCQAGHKVTTPSKLLHIVFREMIYFSRLFVFSDWPKKEKGIIIKLRKENDGKQGAIQTNKEMEISSI
jgi:hypothetical protein